MAAYIRAADAIRDALDCLVIIVHHCGHDGNRPRGHSSLMGALDVQIAVSRDATGNIVAEHELSKDGEVGLQFASRLVQREVALIKTGTPSRHASWRRLKVGAGLARPVPHQGPHKQP
jgi:hypothetical protein